MRLSFLIILFLICSMPVSAACLTQDGVKQEAMAQELYGNDYSALSNSQQNRVLAALRNPSPSFQARLHDVSLRAYREHFPASVDQVIDTIFAQESSGDLLLEALYQLKTMNNMDQIKGLLRMADDAQSMPIDRSRRSDARSIDQIVQERVGRAFRADAWSTGSSTSGTFVPNRFGLPADVDILVQSDMGRGQGEPAVRRMLPELEARLQEIYGTENGAELTVHLNPNRVLDRSGFTTYFVSACFGSCNYGRLSDGSYGATNEVLGIDITVQPQADTAAYRTEFDRQMDSIVDHLTPAEQVAAREYLRDQVRYLKHIFQQERAYKPKEQGLRGLGLEQLVMQLPYDAQNLDDLRLQMSLEITKPSTLAELQERFSADAALEKILRMGRDLKLIHPTLGVELVADYGAHNPSRAVDFDKVMDVARKHRESPQMSEQELRSRIHRAETIRGTVNRNLFTHNTPVESMLGILASGGFRTSGSRGANFRYGLDSDYGAVKFIMRDGFENTPGLMGKDHGSLQQTKLIDFFETRRSTTEIDETTDFRRHQNPSDRSYANPQLQIGTQDGSALGLEHVAAVMVPAHVWDVRKNRRALERASREYGFEILHPATPASEQEYFAWKGRYTGDGYIPDYTSTVGSRDAAIEQGMARPHEFRGVHPAMSVTETTGRDAFLAEQQEYYRFLMQQGLMRTTDAETIPFPGLDIAAAAASMEGDIEQDQEIREDAVDEIQSEQEIIQEETEAEIPRDAQEDHEVPTEPESTDLVREQDMYGNLLAEGLLSEQDILELEQEDPGIRLNKLRERVAYNIYQRRSRGEPLTDVEQKVPFLIGEYAKGYDQDVDYRNAVALIAMEQVLDSDLDPLNKAHLLEMVRNGRLEGYDIEDMIEELTKIENMLERSQLRKEQEQKKEEKKKYRKLVWGIPFGALLGSALFWGSGDEGESQEDDSAVPSEDGSRSARPAQPGSARDRFIRAIVEQNQRTERERDGALHTDDSGEESGIEETLSDIFQEIVRGRMTQLVDEEKLPGFTVRDYINTRMSIDLCEDKGGRCKPECSDNETVIATFDCMKGSCCRQRFARP